MSYIHRMRAPRAMAAATSCAALMVACSGPRVVTTPPPVPVAAAAPASVAAVDLTKPPTLGAPPSLRPPQITTRELPNGLKIVVLEQRDQRRAVVGAVADQERRAIEPPRRFAAMALDRVARDDLDQRPPEQRDGHQRDGSARCPRGKPAEIGKPPGRATHLGGSVS